MADETRPVSVRVPKNLPEEIKAITGLPFSRAVVNIMVAFVEASKRNQQK